MKEYKHYKGGYYAVIDVVLPLPNDKTQRENILQGKRYIVQDATASNDDIILREIYFTNGFYYIEETQSYILYRTQDRENDLWIRNAYEFSLDTVTTNSGTAPRFVHLPSVDESYPYLLEN